MEGRRKNVITFLLRYISSSSSLLCASFVFAEKKSHYLLLHSKDLWARIFGATTFSLLFSNFSDGVSGKSAPSKNVQFFTTQPAYLMMMVSLDVCGLRKKRKRKRNEWSVLKNENSHHWSRWIERCHWVVDEIKPWPSLENKFFPGAEKTPVLLKCVPFIFKQSCHPSNKFAPEQKKYPIQVHNK